MDSNNWWNKISKMRYDLSKRQIFIIVIVVLILGRIFGRDLISPQVPQNEAQNVRTVSDGSKQEICLNNATKEAQENIGVFLNSVEKLSSNLKTHSVKKEFVDRGEKEHMWVSVVSYKDDKFIGVLNNEPVWVKNIRIGDVVAVNKGDVEDWNIASEKDGQFNLEAGLYSEKCFKESTN